MSLARFFALSLLLCLCQQKVSYAEPEPTKEKKPAQSGYQLGDFIFKPELGFTGVYDDNIFVTRTDKQSDRILIFSPAMNISSDWEKHELELFASADIGRYEDYDTEDYDDFRLGTSGRFDLSEKDNLFAGLNYSEAHESRASPDSFLVYTRLNTVPSMHMPEQ